MNQSLTNMNSIHCYMVEAKTVWKSVLPMYQFGLMVETIVKFLHIPVKIYTIQL